jgi:hypothetical protein
VVLLFGGLKKDYLLRQKYSNTLLTVGNPHLQKNVDYPKKLKDGDFLKVLVVSRFI